MTTMLELEALEIGQDVPLGGDNRLIRMPGGWVYEGWSPDGSAVTSCFVPDPAAQQAWMDVLKKNIVGEARLSDIASYLQCIALILEKKAGDPART